MKVAVVGAGSWGSNIIRTFGELGVLHAIVESDTQRHAELITRYPNVTVLSDVNSLVLSDMDAVAVATPPASHAQIAAAMIRAGKDVFVEKPLTLSREQALWLQKVALENKRILMVGHMLLYQPSIRWIKDYIEAGYLGQMCSIHQERLNLGRARNVENALWSLGVHDIAVLLYLVGSTPVSQSVAGQTVLQPRVEDDVYLHMEFPSGVLGHLHVSWLWPEKRRGLTVIGTNGMIEYDELSQSVTLHRKGIKADLSNRDEGQEIVYQGDGEPLKLELQHFLDCVRERRVPISDAQNGVDVVTVLENATQQFQAMVGA